MAEPAEEASDAKPGSSKEDSPRGATCSQLTEDANVVTRLQALYERQESEIEDLNSFPLPLWTPHHFNQTFRGSHNPQRRFSTLLAPTDAYYQQYHRNQRHGSMPFISRDGDDRLRHDYDLKKLMMDSSRRSSFESAYHSQRSDPMSRTPTSSRMDFVNDSNTFQDDMFDFVNQPYPSYEDLEREITDRRNSLSYDAIRSYFLERSPYINFSEQYNYCLDHDQMSSMICPRCHRRRSIAPNYFFRTSAHQAVIERQFEDLFNIPGPNRSRSTSIDFPETIRLSVPNQEEGDHEYRQTDGGETADEASNNKGSIANNGENQNGLGGAEP